MKSFGGSDRPVLIFPNRGIGTCHRGNHSDKIDYPLLSPSLFARVTNVGLCRKGAWLGAPARQGVHAEITAQHHAASDIHLIFADIGP